MKSIIISVLFFWKLDFVLLMLIPSCMKRTTEMMDGKIIDTSLGNIFFFFISFTNYAKSSFLYNGLKIY